MNELTIPSSPNWFCSTILCCAPDNTVVYGSRRDIVIIHPKDSSDPADVQMISLAHNDRITALSLNNATWGDPEKLAVSVGEDRIVKLWNLDTGTLKNQHKEHEKNANVLVGVSIAGERVISVSENGCIMIWRIATNSVTILPDIFNQKVRIKCVSTCPHASWLTAFGLYSGLVIVADLRKNGKILYRMRGNETEITSLSWCPLPINIYKTEEGVKVENVLKTKSTREKIEIKQKTNDSDASGEQSQSEPDQTEKSSKSSELKSNEEIVTDKLPLLEITENEEKISTEKVEEVENINTEKNIDRARIEKEITNLVECAQSLLSNSENVMEEITKIEVPKYDMDSRKKSEYKKVDKTNPWGNVVFNDSDDEQQDEEDLQKRKQDHDFLRECQNLRKAILDDDDEDDIFSDITVLENESHLDEQERVTEMFEEIQPEKNAVLDNAMKNLKLDSEDKEKSKSSESLEFHDAISSLTPKKSIATSKRFIAENNDKEYLLASACKGGIICIWRALTDGRMQLMLPANGNYSNPNRRNKSHDDKKNRWISLYWIKPDILISASIQYQLYCWNLIPHIEPNKKLSKSTIFKPRLVHSDHRRSIFTIAAPYKLYSEMETTSSWDKLANMNAWTVSKDRWILCTSLGIDRKTCASYPCLGGVITHMTVSPIDPNKLAIGVADGSIRIWDLSHTQTQVITMTCLWDKVKSKVTYLDWHPVKENCIAFATSEGRIGTFDVNNVSKLPVIFSNYHRYSVHKIQWGPLPNTLEKKYGLYSSSGGELIAHDASKPNTEPIKIEIEDSRVTTFAWKSDYSIIAVGTKEGHVKLVSKDFVVYETFYMQKKAVQCVVWHPQSTVSGISPFANYLAVATNESDIYVYDCLQIKGKNDDNSSKLVAVLKGHYNSVKYLSWCPQIDGRLVSASEDGVAMVWNVSTQTLLSTFKDQNRDNIVCVLWSPLDADLIISGGKDNVLKIWRITKYPPISFEKEKKEKKKSSKTPKPEEDTEDTESTSVISENIKITKQNILPSISRLQNVKHGETITTCKKLLKLLDEAKAKSQTSSDTEDSSSEDEEDTQEKETEIDTKISDPVQLFGNRKDMLSILNHEQETHLTKYEWDSTHHIALWQGDLSKSIEKAVKSEVLNPWIISLAPMVSHKLWAELCLKYAEKLSEEGHGLMASSYFLACHQIIKAIDVLCASNMHREALAVAKCRLPSNDQVISKIYEKWATFANSVGNYEIAAQCYIKLGKLSEAGELLNKRSDKETLEVAADLAKRSNNTDLLKTVNVKLEALNNEQSNTTEETNEKYPAINISQSRFHALLAHGSKKETVNDQENDCDDDNNTQNEI